MDELNDDANAKKVSSGGKRKNTNKQKPTVLIQENSSLTSGSAKQPTRVKPVSEKQIDMYEIHYGMPYDEWIKTRDRFLLTHNMTPKID